MKVKSLSCVRLFATPWTESYQTPPSLGFSRQEYWSGVPSPYQLTNGKSSIPGRGSSIWERPVVTGNIQGAAKSSEVWLEGQQDAVADREQGCPPAARLRIRTVNCEQLEATNVF